MSLCRVAALYVDSWRGFPRPAWLLAAGVFVNNVGAMALAFASLYVVEELGLPPEAAGRALLAYGLASIVGSQIAGRLADRIGPKRLLVGALAANGLILPWLAATQSEWQIIGLLSLYGLTNSGFRPGMNLAAMSYLPWSERSRAYSLNLLALNLGGMAAGAVGGFVAAHWFPALFVLDGLTALAAAAWLAVALPATPPASRKAEGSAASRSPWRDRPFLVLCVGLLLVATADMAAMAVLPLFAVRDLGASEMQFGALLAFDSALIILLTVPATDALKRVPHLATMIGGAALFVAAFVALALANGIAFVWLAQVFMSLALVIFFPAALGAVTGMAGEASRGAYLGLYHALWGVAYVAGPSLGTWLYAAAGAQAHWAAGAAGMLAALVVFALLRRRETAQAFKAATPAPARQA